MWLTKELSYVDKYLELTEKRPYLHPSFRMPGTITGRLSSKDPNMQQIPKTKDMMKLFVADPGTVWVDLDFSALEPMVTTEFSQDPNMLAIYGNGRPGNDIYLYVGANIPGEMGKKIRATGYDPLNPTKEGLARAKKECKHERSICKVISLACGYGSGVKKVNQILEDDDIFLPWEQVETIHSTYWKVFAGVKQFSRDLQNQLRKNGGFILNGLGRPMAVSSDYEQDCLNRFVQSTGHDILVKYACILERLLSREGIPWKPVIMDFHDSACVSVPEQYGERVAALFLEGVDVLNREIGGSILLRGVPTVGYNLAATKEPES
jgi:DNA polymerase-1